MEWIGLALGLLGLAVGLIPLASESDVPAGLHQPLLYGAFALVVVGIAIGFAPLRKPVIAGWRRKFGPYPFMPIYQFACKVGLAGDGEKTIKFFRQLLDAGTEGRFKFYGQLVTDNGKEEYLTEIPCEHLKTHAINVTTALMFDEGLNDQVCTYNPRDALGERNLVGCYYNLHASRDVMNVVKEIWEADRTSKGS
jgi:hypothetical protein